MQILIHQTQHRPGEFEKIFETIQEIVSQHQNDPDPQVHLFPEFFLTGTPQKACYMQRHFQRDYQSFLNSFEKWSLGLKASTSKLYLMGGLSYEWNTQTPNKFRPKKIDQVIFTWRPGQKLVPIHSREIFPNNVLAVDKATVYQFENWQLGVLSSEDIENFDLSKNASIQRLHTLAKTQALDLAIVLNTTPFHLTRHEIATQNAKEISKYLGVPLYYINPVTAHNDILFDGASFGVNQARLLFQCAHFKSDHFSYEYGSLENDKSQQTQADTHSGRVNIDNNFIKILSHQDCEQIINGMIFGLQEYALKQNFNKFLVELSGEINSAVVLTIAKLALKPGQELEAIYMPGLNSLPQSFELSAQLCQNLSLKLHSLPIKFFHSTIRLGIQDNLNSALEGVADEKLQQDLRGLIANTRSNQTGAMVLNSLSLSEIAMGNFTPYGDSVGDLAILGDLYKSEVFQLAQHINHERPLIPQSILVKSSKKLEVKQKNLGAQSLPCYENLDPILEGLMALDLEIDELCRLGLDAQEVQQVYHAYHLAKSISKQLPPVIKMRPFHFGHHITF